MTDEHQNHPKGHVEFHQPAVKLVADLATDEDMRAHLNEMKATDGYPGSCGTCEENK